MFVELQLPMSDLPSTFISQQLTPEEQKHAMESLPNAWREIFGDCLVTIRYGWGCKIHPALLYTPMPTGIAWIDRFIADSLRQEIVMPGDSDFLFEDPDKRLEVVFCHEGHVHIGGNDPQAIARILSFSPFSTMVDSREKRL